MTCPECNQDFTLTWSLYARAPLGRLRCPLCATGLVGRHRWFYWPLTVLGCTSLALPLGIVGARVIDHHGALVGWIIGGLTLGIPVDRYLEGRFTVLRVRNRKIPLSQTRQAEGADHGHDTPDKASQPTDHACT